MGQYGKQPCEVVAVDPGKLLAYTFSDGTLNTTITWRLAAEGDGTRLFLEQAGFDLESPVSRQAYTGMGSGWPHVLARIEGILDDMTMDRQNGSVNRRSTEVSRVPGRETLPFQTGHPGFSCWLSQGLNHCARPGSQ